MNQPNMPCECGSGKKQKKCHPLGAPMYGPALEPQTPKQKADEEKKTNGKYSPTFWSLIG